MRPFIWDVAKDLKTGSRVLVDSTICLPSRYLSIARPMIVLEFWWGDEGLLLRPLWDK